jgi:hypothetical protein
MSRIAILVVLVLAACVRDAETPIVEKRAPASVPASVKTPPVPPAAIRTDRSSYVLANSAKGPEAMIVATLRAPADKPLYILNCNGASGLTLQRKDGEEWVYAWLVSMSACMSPPIVVPPGGEHTARLLVHQHAGAVTHREALRSGTYRMVWTGVLSSFDSNKEGYGPEAPLEQRVSAPFTIEVPERPAG